MEMPCMCKCGEWFDLNDGYSSKNSNEVICSECHNKEQEIESIIDEIEDLEMQGNKKREIKKLQKKLTELGELANY